MARDTSEEKEWCLREEHRVKRLVFLPYWALLPVPLPINFLFLNHSSLVPSSVGISCFYQLVTTLTSH